MTLPFEERSGERPESAPSQSPVSLVLALTLTVLAVLVWARFAPPERSLGSAIRIVYLHVSATWAGITVLYGVGLAGIVNVLWPKVIRRGRLRSFWISGSFLFGAGFALSLVSAQVSWGGVFWAEPRMRASLGVVAVALVAQTVEALGGGRRFMSLVWTAAAILMFVVLRSADLFMHPDGPIRPDTPDSIKATFFGMFGLFVAIAVLLALVLREPRDA